MNRNEIIFSSDLKDFIPSASNELWVSDITYIAIWRDKYNCVFCCLSMILDAYSEEIVGWSVGSTLETIYPAASLKVALKRIEEQENVNLIHHSDRGCQYASNEYVSILKRHGIPINMTGSGDPKENAQAERINNTMKDELLKGVVFYSIEEVRTAVGAAVDFYNNEKPHLRINMMTPVNTAKCSGEIEKNGQVID